MADESSQVDERQWAELMARAEVARGQAHAPYSRFFVGAALLDANGRTFVGCNVENSSYGLSQCAERTAVCTAVSQGSRQFTALVVASEGGVAPCGACRQVLAEFARNVELQVLLVDVTGQRPSVRTDLSKLLPRQFHLDSRDR